MTILSSELNAVIKGDAADLIASKLAAQNAAIAANVSAIAATIVDGDTTHAPDGNSVFDALALKRNTAFTPTTSGDWTPAPTTIQIALDQLAARVKALEP